MRPLLLLAAALCLLCAAPVGSDTSAEGNTKDIGEHGKRDSQYYKWQRDKEDVKTKAAEAKERQLAREAAQSSGKPAAELTAEEKELRDLRRLITRKEQYKREAIQSENFEEAARLRDEIDEASGELEALSAAAKASREQCEDDGSADDEMTVGEEDEEEEDDEDEDEDEDEDGGRAPSSSGSEVRSTRSPALSAAAARSARLCSSVATPTTSGSSSGSAGWGSAGWNLSGDKKYLHIQRSTMKGG